QPESLLRRTVRLTRSQNVHEPVQQIIWRVKSYTLQEAPRGSWNAAGRAPRLPVTASPGRADAPDRCNHPAYADSPAPPVADRQGGRQIDRDSLISQYFHTRRRCKFKQCCRYRLIAFDVAQSELRSEERRVGKEFR